MEIQNADFVNVCINLFGQCSGNQVLIPDLGKVTLFDTPLIGFASAQDEIFMRYKEPNVIGPLFWGPREWLPSAQTVTSFFLPFTAEVRESNREDRALPSAPWLYGRIEGQQFIQGFMEHIQNWLTDQGIGSCVPILDKRFKLQKNPVTGKSGRDFHVESRWSERHAAYACGLGTFGLSRGLITKKGMAGRFASIVLEAALVPDTRKYIGIDDYCTKCGACAARCPAGAITLEFGKNNIKCSKYVDELEIQYAPRFGCGKCQTKVPCEYGIPPQKK